MDDIGEAIREVVLESLSRQLANSKCGDQLFLLLGGQAFKAGFEGHAGETMIADGSGTRVRAGKKVEHHTTFVLEDAWMPDRPGPERDVVTVSTGLLFDVELQSIVGAMRRKGTGLVVVLDIPFPSNLIQASFGLRCRSRMVDSPGQTGRVFALYSPWRTVHCFGLLCKKW